MLSKREQLRSDDGARLDVPRRGTGGSQSVRRAVARDGRGGARRRGPRRRAQGGRAADAATRLSTQPRPPRRRPRPRRRPPRRFTRLAALASAPATPLHALGYASAASRRDARPVCRDAADGRHQPAALLPQRRRSSRTAGFAPPSRQLRVPQPRPPMDKKFGNCKHRGTRGLFFFFTDSLASLRAGRSASDREHLGRIRRHPSTCSPAHFGSTCTCARS